jgi:hypothetical protein
VDDRIEDWKKANQVTEIQWKGTWTGKPMAEMDQGSFMMSMPDHMGHDMGDASGTMDEMEHLASGTDRADHFYDDVTLRSVQSWPAEK